MFLLFQSSFEELQESHEIPVSPFLPFLEIDEDWVPGPIAN